MIELTSILFNRTQNCNSEDAEWDVVGEEDLTEDNADDSHQAPKLVAFQILPGLFIVLVPIIVVVGVVGVVQYVTGRWNLHPWESSSPTEQPATTDEPTPESRLKQAETTQTEVEEWLAEAEAARQRGNDAMEAGDYNQAAEAYGTALEHFQTVRTQLPDDDDRHQTVETAVTELQEAHQEAVQHRDQESLPTQNTKDFALSLPEIPSWIPQWLIYPTIVLGGVATGFLLGVYFGGGTGIPVTQGQFNTKATTRTFRLFVILTPLAFLSMYVGISVLMGWGLHQLRNSTDLVGVPNDSGQSDSAASPRSDPDQSPETLIEEGDAAQAAGDAAQADGDYETAVEKYSAAIDAYEQARQRLDADADDQAQAVSTALDTVETAHQEAVQQRDERANLRQGLEVAEADLATATREHSQGNETVARIRYRQARDRYDNVLTELDMKELEPPVEVSLDHEGRPGLGTVEGVTEEVNESVRALVAADDDPAPAVLREAGVDELSELDGVDKELAQRLLAWARVPTADTRQFETREDITERREFAVEGFQHCQ